MRLVPLSQIPELSHGETVPSVRGTLTAVYPQNSGVRQDNTQWRLQNLMLKEGGMQIKVKVDDRDEILASWKGREVILACNDGPKGLTGIKVKDDEYRGKVTRILHVTPSAHLDPVDGQVPAPPAPRPAPTVMPPVNHAEDQIPGAEMPAVRPATNPSGRGQRITEQATKRARDYYRVMEAALAMRQAWDEHHPETPMTSEQYQAAVSTLFIALQRDGVINGGDQ